MLSYKKLKGKWFNGKYTQDVDNIVLIIRETEKAYLVRELILKHSHKHTPLFNTLNFSSTSYWIPKSKITEEIEITKKDIDLISTLQNETFISLEKYRGNNNIKDNIINLIENKNLLKYIEA